MANIIFQDIKNLWSLIFILVYQRGNSVFIRLVIISWSHRTVELKLYFLNSFFKKNLVMIGIDHMFIILHSQTLKKFIFSIKSKFTTPNKINVSKNNLNLIGMKNEKGEGYKIHISVLPRKVPITIKVDLPTENILSSLNFKIIGFLFLGFIIT